MKKAGEILARLFDKSTFSAAQGYSELFSSWDSIVGDPYSAHSRIVELENSIIVVEADHPGWIQLLQTRQKELLDRARSRFPSLSISGITFRLYRTDGRIDTSKSIKNHTDESTRSPDYPGISPSASDIGIDDTTSTEPLERIEDESFKKALRNLERSIKARNSDR
jgi:hypothetical protein